MMSSDEQHQQAADAVEEAIAWDTVGIVVGTGEKELREIGTGTALLVDGQRFILTARHVIEDTPNEALRFMFRPHGPLIRAERDRLRKLSEIPFEQLNLIETVDVRGRVLSNSEDLALLLVDADVEDHHRVRFFELDLQSKTPAVGQPVIAMGYPSDLATQIDTGNFVAFSSIEWTEIVDDRDLPSYERANHYLTPYHMVEHEPTAHPKGFSGSGMWYRIVPTPEKELWLPNLRMAGVVVGYYRRLALLRAIRVERVAQFLESVTPDRSKIQIMGGPQ